MKGIRISLVSDPANSDVGYLSVEASTHGVLNAALTAIAADNGITSSERVSLFIEESRLVLAHVLDGFAED